ncbi:hypothetical protein LEP1GSC170_0955 [Leptospira interrogans serovar Bataviae str. HAI135]|nr:hypothetical protein LEP1GSC170_0955 [Leptospira interrogans serovar Bataviae str. HAI135]
MEIFSKKGKNMPSCSWYGTLKDHIEILNYLFQKKNCSIYESYSDFEKPIRIFSNVEEIIQEFQSNTIFLNIYVQGSGPKFKARKILLDPKNATGLNIDLVRTVGNDSIAFEYKY